jgi:hypothetical protein
VAVVDGAGDLREVAEDEGGGVAVAPEQQRDGGDVAEVPDREPEDGGGQREPFPNLD